MYVRGAWSVRARVFVFVDMHNKFTNIVIIKILHISEIKRKVIFIKKNLR